MQKQVKISKNKNGLSEKGEEEFQKYFNYSSFFAIFSDSETKNLEFKKSYYHIDKLIEYVFKNLKPIKTMKELEGHYWFFKILLDFIEILKKKSIRKRTNPCLMAKSRVSQKH